MTSFVKLKPHIGCDSNRLIFLVQWKSRPDKLRIISSLTVAKINWTLVVSCCLPLACMLRMSE